MNKAMIISWWPPRLHLFELFWTPRYVKRGHHETAMAPAGSHKQAEVLSELVVEGNLHYTKFHLLGWCLLRACYCPVAYPGLENDWTTRFENLALFLPDSAATSTPLFCDSVCDAFGNTSRLAAVRVLSFLSDVFRRHCIFDGMAADFEKHLLVLGYVHFRLLLLPI
jgi:hypothetical protein